MPHTEFALFLTCYISMAHLLQLKKSMDILPLTKVYSLNRFLKFHLMLFFFFQDSIQVTVIHLFVMSPYALLGCDTFFIASDKLNSFEGYWLSIL